MINSRSPIFKGCSRHRWPLAWPFVFCFVAIPFLPLVFVGQAMAEPKLSLDGTFARENSIHRRGADWRTETVFQEFRVQRLRREHQLLRTDIHRGRYLFGSYLTGIDAPIADNDTALFRRIAQYKQEQRHTPKKVALLFHGNGETPEELRAVIEELEQHDYLVYAPREPGVGKTRIGRSLLTPWKSTRHDDSIELPNSFNITRNKQNKVTTEDNEFADLALQKARELAGPNAPIFVAGISRGGAIAAYTALQHSSEVSGMALYSPAFAIKQNFPNFALIGFGRTIQLAERWLPKSFFSSVIDRIPFRSATVANLAKRVFQHESMSSWPMNLGHGYATMRFIDSTYKLARPLSVPTVIFSSENDRIVSSCALANFYNQIGGATKGHRWIHYPKSAKAVRHALIDLRVSDPHVSRDIARTTRQHFDTLATRSHP